MKEKTLEDFKKEFAISKNLLNWSDVLFMVLNNMISAQEFGHYCDEVSENYANHVKAIALQEGFEKGCKEQKIVCAEHAKTVKQCRLPIFAPGVVNPTFENIISLDSIFHAPDAVSPYTK